MTLRELRLEKDLTQEQAAKLLGITRRTYIKYEKDPTVIAPIKYKFIYQTIEKYNMISENQGILKLDKIKSICKPIFERYGVEFAYLFGSYAKNKATEISDVDLLVSTSISGLKFFEFVEVLRESLKKKVDVLDINQLDNNAGLSKEILKDGIRIYG